MQAIFTTRAYASRQSDPTRVYHAYATPVTAGLELMWDILVGRERNDQGGLSDHLGKGRVIVGDGGAPATITDRRLSGANTMWAELEPGFPIIDAGRALFRATFADGVADFRWREVGLTTVQGVLICRAVANQDTKAPGTRRTVDVTLELVTTVAPPAPSRDETALLALL